MIRIKLVKLYRVIFNYYYKDNRYKMINQIWLIKSKEELHYLVRINLKNYE